jgi:uncharacterized lipoprotein YbaY
MRRLAALSLIFGATLAAFGCASTQTQGEARPSVTGSVALPAGAEIISGAVVHVKLVDMTAGNRELGSQSIERPNAFPVDFTVRYSPGDLVAGHSYGIEASVEVNGATKYRSSSPIAVLGEGNPTSVRVQTEATN